MSHLRANVRHWLEADISSVRKLMRDLAIFEHDLHNFDNFYAKDDLLENGFQTLPPELYCLVAEEDAEVVGILVYFLLPTTETAESEMWITYLFVTQPMRGQGVGRNLMRRAAFEAKNLGCGFIRWVADENDPAKRFYESLGACSDPHGLSYGLVRAALETLAGQT